MPYLIRYLKQHSYWIDFKVFEKLDLIELINEIRTEFNCKEIKLRVIQLIEADGEEKTKIIKKVIMTCTVVDSNFVIEK